MGLPFYQEPHYPNTEGCPEEKYGTAKHSIKCLKPPCITKLALETGALNVHIVGEMAKKRKEAFIIQYTRTSITFGSRGRLIY